MWRYEIKVSIRHKSSVLFVIQVNSTCLNCLVERVLLSVFVDDVFVTPLLSAQNRRSAMTSTNCVVF